MTPEEIARIRTLGVRGFMREIAENKHCQPTSQARDEAEALLRVMQEEESLARDAASNAKTDSAIFWARHAAYAAYVAAAIAAISIAITIIIAYVTAQP